MVIAVERFESHAHAGPGGIVYVVQGGDLHTYRPDPGYRLSAVGDRAARTPEHLLRQPSRLLSGAHRIIDFYGREDELHQLRQWCDSPDDFGVLLIHGSGGQGKTRLAHEFARRCAAADWTALEMTPTASGFDPAPDSAHLTVGDRGCLVVVDYAERWSVSLLRAALADARLHEHKTRVLLLARPAGTWWQRIDRYLSRSFDIDPEAMQLQPFSARSGDRQRLFAMARDRFALLLEVPQARHLEPPPGWSIQATALEIQMAALAVVYATARGDQPPTDPGALSVYLLKREHEHWAELHERAGMPTRPETMARAVYLACLTGPLRYAEAVALVTGVGLATAGDQAESVIDDHGVSYPFDDSSVLAPMQPDRMAEDFIALQSTGYRGGFSADPWTDDRLSVVLRTLAASAPHRVSAMLTTAVTVAQRWAPFAHEHLGPLLHDESSAVLFTGGPLLTALAELSTLDAATLTALEAEMPVDGRPDLMDPLATITQRLYDKLRAANASSAVLVPLGYRLARRLVRADRHAEALAPIEEAVDRGRRSRPRPPSDRDLARALSCLTEVLAELGQERRAMESAEEAFDLWLAITPVGAELAAHLDHYSRLLHAQRRYLEAAERQIEASELWAGLAADQPELSLQLARSLTAQAMYCRAARLDDLAYIAVRDAADIWERLDEAAAGGFRIELLDALTAVAAALDSPLSVRVDAGERAARGFGAMWPADITLLPRTAVALRAWAAALSESGDHSGAFEKIGEARKISLRLVNQNRSRYATVRAAVLLTYARCCLAAKRDLGEGLTAARVAEQIYHDQGSADAATAAGRVVLSILREREVGGARPKVNGVFEQAATVSTGAKPSMVLCMRCGGRGRYGTEPDVTVCMRCGGAGIVSERL